MRKNTKYNFKTYSLSSSKGKKVMLAKPFNPSKLLPGESSAILLAFKEYLISK